MFMHTNEMYRRRKVSLEGGGGCQAVSTVIAVNEFVKRTRKLICEEGIHRRPYVRDEKFSKPNNTAGGESTNGR